VLNTSTACLEQSLTTAFPVDNINHPWFRAVRLTVAIGIAYFLAARLGFALTSHAGLAFFWPAAGIATGALIALGPAARLPVGIGVAFASVACNLMVGRNPWLSMAFVVLNAGEVLFTAWLIERWYGAVFKLEDVRQVLGFLVASAIAVAICAAGAAIAVRFVEPTVFPLHVWRIWFSAGLLGTVSVAPLLIGLREAARDVPPRRERVEGTLALVMLAALCAFLISLPQGSWATALPVALAFPVLLWVAVRCRPVFAAAAMLVVTLAVVWSATFNLGHFGDASIPRADRVLAAQTLVLASTCWSSYSPRFSPRGGEAMRCSDKARSAFCWPSMERNLAPSARTSPPAALSAMRVRRRSMDTTLHP
jgi:integral membrane sensor domain MASE1